jgi:riboflavin synthase alpha subunit
MMFTGVIEQTGKVISVDDRRTQRRILIQTRWNDLKAGETISVNGISLPVHSVNLNP